MTDADTLAHILEALLSRHDHWTLEEVDCSAMGVRRPRWRLTVNGSVLLDKQHAQALLP